MTDKNKEDGKANEGNDPVVETQAGNEATAAAKKAKESKEEKVETPDEKAVAAETNREKNEREKAEERQKEEILKLIDTEDFDEALELAKELPGNSAELKEAKDTLIEQINDAKMAAEKPAGKKQSVAQLVKAGKYGEAKEAIKDEGFGEEKEAALIAKVDKAESDAREAAEKGPQEKADKANKKAAAAAKRKAGKPITLDSVEKDLFKLIGDVDTLTKARQKSGKPNHLLMVLHKRLQTVGLHYMNFKNSSKP